MPINPQPLVSIVTPSYNQADYLEETIQSVLAQTYPNIEYILIDGGSTDGSVEIIRKYETQLAYWVSRKDRGQTEAINTGFGQASGKILAWLNSDDTYLPPAVEQAVAFLQKNPEVGLVYGDTNFIDSDGQTIGRFNAQQTNYQRLRRGGVYLPQQSAFWRAELWHRVGPLDPSFYFAMDYDLWVRLARISEIRYVPELWANFRLHAGAKTIAADERCWPEMLRVHRRDGGHIFSVIYARYYLRRLLAPLIHRHRKNLFSRRS